MTYQRATLEEYGFKERKVLKKIWSITKTVCIVFSLVMLYASIVIIAIQSFNKSSDITTFTGFTFDNYINMFEKKSLTNSIINTFLVSIVATAISTVLGTLIAIGLFYLPAKYRQKILLLNNIPLLNADIVTGISIMLIFSMFLPIFPYLFGFGTLLIAHVFFTLPYIILSVLPKMKEMDKDMLNASLDLGVKPFRSVAKVIVPAIKGGIFSGMVLAFTISFEDFVVGYFTTGNGFSTMSIWIYSSIGRKSLYPGVYAFSTVLTFLTLTIIVVYNLVKGRKKHEKKN